ncbi:MBL fold metallo-hydrolase [Tsuneonella sp. HG222]
MKRSAILSAIVVTGVAAACATQPGDTASTGGNGGAPSGVVATTPMDSAPPNYVPGGGPGLPGISPIEHVKGNVYKIFGAGGNTTVFLMDDGVAIVDTKLANNGQKILDEIRKVSDKPVTLVINTHSHPDHNGSNQFFKDQRPTVEVVAQANTALRMSKPVGPMPANPATRQFGDTMTLGSGKNRIDLYYTGPAHTDGDAFVVFANDKVMAMGDAMAWSMAPLIDGNSGGSAVKAADTMERLVRTVKNVDTIVEGHGYIQPWQRLVDFAAFNRALVDESRRVQAAGGQPKDVVTALIASGKYAPFLKPTTLTGLEYGSTGQNRALINAMVAFAELKGEKPPLIMNLPPDQGYKP